MKRMVMLTAVFSASAFAHEAEPETKFFKDELAKNPMVSQVLAWCHIIGLESEESCRAEMYKGQDALDPVRLDAASKCVEKAGLKYKAALDNYFKDSVKNAVLVSHPSPTTGKKHLFPMKDSSTPKEPAHYYFYTAVDRQEAAFKMGDVFVARLKSDYEGHTSTSTTSGSGTVTTGVNAGIFTGEGSMTVGGETATTKPKLSPEVLQAERAKGEAYGRAHPESSGIEPGGYCVVGGKCEDMYHQFPEDQLQAEVEKDVLPKPEEKVEPKPKEEELPPDPFGPFTSETATGGMPTEPLKIPTTEQKPKEQPKDSNTTTLSPGEFASSMADCMEKEEYKILEEEGKETKDPDAKSEEEKRAEAEAKLKEGYCDASILGVRFCEDWKAQLSKTEAQNAATEKQAAYDQAMENWKKNGICDSVTLGYDFCKMMENSLTTTPVDEPLPEEGNVISGWDNAPAHANPEPLPMCGWDPTNPNCPGSENAAPTRPLD